MPEIEWNISAVTGLSCNRNRYNDWLKETGLQGFLKAKLNTKIMKRLFKNVNTFGLTGMLVMGLLVFTQGAFKSDSHRAEGEYFFNGADASQIQDVDVWGTTLDMSLYRCVTNATLPCKITVPRDETLAEYLDNHQLSEIIDNADSKRTDAP